MAAVRGIVRDAIAAIELKDYAGSGVRGFNSQMAVSARSGDLVYLKHADDFVPIVEMGRFVC